jgi:hypothetical protein
MTNVANSRFTIKSWDEKPYSEGQDLPKLTRAAVTRTFTGDIAGEGQVEYLMMYSSDGSATFVGLERIVGHVAGKAGSFVLQRTGIFENGVAKESYFVIPGSGTGERSAAVTRPGMTPVVPILGRSAWRSDRRAVSHANAARA